MSCNYLLSWSGKRIHSVPEINIRISCGYLAFLVIVANLVVITGSAILTLSIYAFHGWCFTPLTPFQKLTLRVLEARWEITRSHAGARHDQDFYSCLEAVEHVFLGGYVTPRPPTNLYTLHCLFSHKSKMILSPSQNLFVFNNIKAPLLYVPMSNVQGTQHSTKYPTAESSK